MAAADRDLASQDEEQIRMMEEEVIVTDYFDRVIGKGSKKETHVWDNINAGMLHRAFSVFLFTPDGKLVLQQRAGTKITFPYIWANTCCSHPLSVPSELIEADALGAKNAARRKLQHELGIPPEDVPLESFTWVTRVHYVGACGPAATAVWGEHEIDWILLCAPPVMPRLELNPNEVAEVRAFSQAELREWMRTRAVHGGAVSPWFAVMEASGLVYRWWDAVLDRDVDSVLERGRIHRQNELEAAVEGVASKPLPQAFDACLQATYQRDERKRRHIGPAESALASPTPPLGRGRPARRALPPGILAASPVFSAPVALIVGALTAAAGAWLAQALSQRRGCAWANLALCVPRVWAVAPLAAVAVVSAGVAYFALMLLLPLVWALPPTRTSTPPALSAPRPAADLAAPATSIPAASAAPGLAPVEATTVGLESLPATPASATGGAPSPLRRRSSARLSPHVSL